MTSISPVVTILAHPKVPSPAAKPRADGTPNLPKPGDVRGCALHDALAATWLTDAHLTQYAPVEIPVLGADGVPTGATTPVRLTAEALTEGIAARMTCIVLDIDDEHTHGTGKPARDEWRAEVEPRLEATGLAWYRTRGGARGLMGLAEPVEIRSKDDAEAWSRLYLDVCDHFAAEHNLTFDRTCKDWPRLMRLPNVRRGGKPARAEVHGLDTMIVFDPREHWEDTGARADPPRAEANAPPARAEAEGPARGNPARAAAIGAILGALGDAADYSNKWEICGAIGGITRKAGWRAEDCEDLIRRWATAAARDINEGLSWALASWRKPAEHVSGERELRRALPAVGVADAVMAACTIMARPRSAAERLADADDTDAAIASAAMHGLCLVDRSKPPPVLTYVIEALDLAPGKVSAIQAYANVAKTPFALALTICVAAGIDFLGMHVSQCPAAYVAFEGGVLTEQREARICAGYGLVRANVPLHYFRGDDAMSVAMLDDIESYAIAHRIGLITIDTYGSSLGDVDHNSSEFSHWLKQLGRLSDATGSLVLVLLHENKTDTKDSMRGISGHNSAAGALQAVLRLVRESDDRNVIDVRCTREVRQAFAPFAVRFTDGTEPVITYANGKTDTALLVSRIARTEGRGSNLVGVNSARQDDAQRKVLTGGAAIMREMRESLSTSGASRRELVNVAGCGSDRAASVALRMLTEAGLIQLAPGGGQYAVTDAGRAASDKEVARALGEVAGRFSREA
jgi:hypothetical protein